MSNKIKKLGKAELDKLLKASLKEIDEMPPESFGDVDVLEPDEFDPKYCKIRITTFVDYDIYLELKKRAKEQNTKYQTLLNSLLRKGLSDISAEQFESKLEELKTKVDELSQLGEKRFVKKA